MIDFWEAIGRMATDKALSLEFQNRQIMNHKPREVVVQPHANTKPIAALAIEESDYKLIQDIISPHLNEKFLSLIAAGELFRSFNTQKTRSNFQTVVDAVSQFQPSAAGFSPSYFIALGLVIVDADFREAAAAAGTDLMSLLPKLSIPERERIGSLLTSTPFMAASHEFDTVWDPGCATSLNFRDGYLQPIPVQEPVPVPKAVGAAGSH